MRPQYSGFNAVSFEMLYIFWRIRHQVEAPRSRIVLRWNSLRLFCNGDHLRRRSSIMVKIELAMEKFVLRMTGEHE